MGMRLTIAAVAPVGTPPRPAMRILVVVRPAKLPCGLQLAVDRLQSGVGLQHPCRADGLEAGWAGGGVAVDVDEGVGGGEGVEADVAVGVEFGGDAVGDDVAGEIVDVVVVGDRGGAGVEGCVAGAVGPTMARLTIVAAAPVGTLPVLVATAQLGGGSVASCPVACSLPSIVFSPVGSPTPVPG